MKSPLVDTSLTVENAEGKGYEYNTDILYEPGGNNSNDIEKLAEQGYKLGNPKKSDDAPEHIKPTLYGLYAPITEALLYLRSIPPPDMTLTPEIAEERGYEWVENGVFFEPEAGVDANIEAIDLIRQGYLLGKPSNTAYNLPEHQYFGLYKPIK